MILDMSVLGWAHTLAVTLAMIAGLVVLLRPKGTPRHKAMGRVYLISLGVGCLTALGIYDTGRWFFPHTVSVVTLAFLAVAYLAARFKAPAGWVHIHLTAMLASYYMLIGGAVNEAFLRIEALRGEGPFGSNPALGMTHGVVMLVFVVWIVAANAATFASRRRRARPA